LLYVAVIILRVTNSKGFPRRLKLRQLAKDFLQMQIQRGNNGHDSTEDAR
jgi:hypothetical protein